MRHYILLTAISLILVQVAAGYSEETRWTNAGVKLLNRESYSVIQFSENFVPVSTNSNSTSSSGSSASSKGKPAVISASGAGFKCYLLPAESLDKFRDMSGFDIMAPYTRRIISIFDTTIYNEKKMLSLIALSNALLTTNSLPANGFFSPVNYYKYVTIETNLGSSNLIVTNFKKIGTNEAVPAIITNKFVVTNIGPNYSKRKVYITVKDFGPDYKKSSKTMEEIKTILEKKYADLIDNKNFCYKVFEDSRKLYNEKYYEIGNDTMQYLIDNIQAGVNDSYNKNNDNPFKKNNCYYYLGLNNFKLYNNTGGAESLSNAFVSFKKALAADDFDSQMVNLKYQQFSEIMMSIITNSFAVTDNSFAETGCGIILFDREHFDNYEEF